MPSKLLAMLIFLTVSLGTSVAEGKCFVGPMVLEEGQSVLDDKGCNRCTCEEGALGCTEMYCKDWPKPKGCIVDAFLMKPGQSFSADDGCNTCSCSKAGEFACSLKKCVEKAPTKKLKKKKP